MGVTKHPLFFDPGRHDGLPVDAALIAKLRRSFERASSHGTALAEDFYRRLFGAHPELRSMFPDDMAHQHEKLLASLRAVIEHLERPDVVAPRLAQLGRDHVGYGARPEHYPIVCAHLIDALSAMGSADAGTRADWQTALERVSAAMLRGAATPT